MDGIANFQVFLFHRMGERMRVQGRPVLLLTTIGAKTGKIRQTVLCWFPDSDNSWIVTATAAGSARHPGWYFNMAKNPDKVSIEIGQRTLSVVPQSLKGEERVEAWRQIVALAPGYARYEEKTDRVIPVVRLRAVQ